MNKLKAFKSAFLSVFLSCIFNAELNADSFSSPIIGLKGSAEQVDQHIYQCVQLLDQQKLNDAQIEGLKVNDQVSSLCEADLRNKAQNMAYGFAQKIQKSGILLGFRECNRSAVEPYTTLQQLMKRFHISGLRFVHICDNTQAVTTNLKGKAQ